MVIVAVYYILCNCYRQFISHVHFARPIYMKHTLNPFILNGRRITNQLRLVYILNVYVSEYFATLTCSIMLLCVNSAGQKSKVLAIWCL